MNSPKHRLKRVKAAKRPLVFGAMLAAAGLVVAGLAGSSAHDPAGTVDDPQLEKFRSPSVGNVPTARVGYDYVSGGDAPGSPKSKALRLETEQNGTPPSYAGVEIVNAGIIGKAVSDVGRISFKTRGYSGAGAPRLSIRLSNDHTAFLASFYCQAVMEPTRWKRTLFFGDTATCTIYTNTTSYAAGGGESAWDKLVAGEGGGVTIEQIELVKDETTPDGEVTTSWVDDMRFDGLLFAGPNVTTHSH